MICLYFIQEKGGSLTHMNSIWDAIRTTNSANLGCLLKGRKKRPFVLDKGQ